MNKRIKKKHAKNKAIFNLRNLRGFENEWDSGISHFGELYKKDKIITSFYEHPVEGGYYPNGQIYNKKDYKEFLTVVKHWYRNDGLLYFDELSLFDNGISKLFKSLKERIVISAGVGDMC